MSHLLISPVRAPKSIHIHVKPCPASGNCGVGTVGWGGVGTKKKTKWKPLGAKNDQDVFGFAHVCTKEGRESGTLLGAKND